METRTIHVLLVEDNPGDVRFVREMVREVPDLDIHHVDRLAAGLEHLATRKVDVVLLDLGLPDSQGLDSLRAIIGSGCTAPVVVLTGHDDEALGQQAVREGAQDYLVKGRVAEYALTRAVRYAIERKHTEETLAQSERKYRGLFEDAGDAIFIGDAETAIILDVNKRAERLLDMPRQEIIGMNRADLHPKTDEFAREFAGHVEAGKVTDAESTVIDSKGRLIPVRINATTFELGGRTVVQGVFCDITARKRAEHALKASETRYRRLFEAAKDGILILDAETGRVVDVNPFLVELTGYSHEEFLEKCLWEIGAFKDITASKVSFAELQTKEYIRYEDLPLVTRDGRKIAVEFVSNVYLVDGKKVIQCNIRDITGRKRAEQELRESKQLVDAIIENIPLMIFLKEAQDLRFVVFNKAGEDLLGYDRKDLLGRNDLDLFPPEQAAHFMAKDREALAADFFVDIPEEPILTAKKGTRLLHTRKICIKGDHEVAKYLLGISEDITERKRAEEKVAQNFETQVALNSLLGLSLEGGTIKEFLARALNLILSLKWLAIESKGAIFLADEAGKTLQLQVQENFPEELLAACTAVPFGRCLCGRAAAEQAVQFADRVDDRHDVHYPGIQPHGHYCVPILSGDHVLGVVNLYVKEGHTWSSWEEGFLKAVANALSGTIERIRAKEQIIGQLEELQRWQEVMLGREDRVQELKREVNECRRRAGEPAIYLSQETDPVGSEAAKPRP